MALVYKLRVCMTEYHCTVFRPNTTVRAYARVAISTVAFVRRDFLCNWLYPMRFFREYVISSC